MKRIFPLLLFSVMSVTALWAGNARFSLLTCSPGDEAYSLFGHTALRYVDEEKGIEKIYNYGYFDFDTPNFIWRFILGETDYMVGATTYRSFLYEYRLRGSSVTEQLLDLTPQQVSRLYSLLEENCKPENRVYRYNYFYANCTTMARDKMLEALGEGYRVEYECDTAFSLPTFRECLSAVTQAHPWYSFGINLLMGSDVDDSATREELQFVPANLMNDFGKAYLVDASGNRVPLVKAVNLLVKEDRPPIAHSNLTPFNVSLLLLVFTFIVQLCEIRKKKFFWGFDVLLMSLQGAAGCLLLFMALFSEHPAVGSNYAIIILNPLALFIMPAMIYRIIRYRSPALAWVQVAFAVLFLLTAIIALQSYPIPLYFCAVTILSRSLFLIYKERICELNII